MNGAGKPGTPASFVGVIYNFGEAPITSEPFASLKEAKEWCATKAHYEDCVWIVLSNGTFEAGGIIDGMFEDDEDSFDWEDDEEDESEF